MNDQLKVFVAGEKQTQMTANIIWGLVVISVPVSIICITQTGVNQYVTITFVLLSVLGLIGSFIFERERIRFKWAKRGDVLLSWNFSNGDEIVINKYFILLHFSNKEKRKVKRKIEGLKWGVDNIKEGLEDIRDGNMPLGFLIPTIKVSTTSNAIPEYTYLKRGRCELYFALLELDEGRFFVIDVKQTNRAGEFTFNIKVSLTGEIKFGKGEFESFIMDMGQNNRLEYSYVDQEEYDKLIREEDVS